MSTKDVEQKIELSKPEVTVEEGTVIVKYDKEDFIKNSPVSKKTLKEVEDYFGNFKNKVAEDAAELAAKHFKEKTEIDTLMAHSQFGVYSNDTLETRVQRSRTNINPKTKEKVTGPAVSQVAKLKPFRNKTHLRKQAEMIKEAIGNA